MAVHHCHLDKNPPPQSITIEVTIKSTTCHLVIQLEFKMTNTELLSMAIFLLANDSSEHCGRSEITCCNYRTQYTFHQHCLSFSSNISSFRTIFLCFLLHFMLRTISLLFVRPWRFSARQVYGPLFF